MKTFSVLLFLCLPPLLSLAQSEKGVTPRTPHSALPTPHSTRAVVVGISNYQSPQIPDLQHAHRDAEAFAAWLESPAGGSVPEENITLLTDTAATQSFFASALTGLMEECQPGDRAIIFFSGHGDVESKTIFQLGFLLLYDSPPNNYMAGGFSIDYLRAVISTLAANDVQVLVITDACRAGKLANTNINGPQLTGANLAKQVANEIKILSCQENEFSLESTEWGGGRGVFSFYLIKALNGLADSNKDAIVTLRELDRYLGDEVPAQTAPHSQIPKIVGNLQAQIAWVDAATLADAWKSQDGQENDMGITIPKGQSDAYLSDTDTVNKQLYEAFTIALTRGELLAPAGRCADDLYRQLAQVPELQPLHGLMRRNLAAALQNDPQQALNALMESDPYEVTNWRVNPDKYNDYPRYLERALELLGEKHYMHNTLLAKKLYFEAYLQQRKLVLTQADPATREMERRRAREKLQEAIRLEPQGAYLYYALASTFFLNNPARVDSAEIYCLKAMELAPQWLLPYIDLAYEYHVTQNNYPAGEKWLLSALESHPESYLVMERLAWLRQWQNRTEETLDICRRMIDLKPELASGYGTMGATYWMRGEYALALEWLEKARQLPHDVWLNSFFIGAIFSKRNFDKGYAIAGDLLKSKEIDIDQKTSILSNLMMGLFDHGRYDLMQLYYGMADSLKGYAFFHVIVNLQEAKMLFKLGRSEEAKQRLLGLENLDNTENAFLGLRDAWLGEIAASEGQPEEAETYFEKSIQPRGFSAMDYLIQMEEAHVLYGHFLLRQNRLEEAELRFRQALEWRYYNSCKGWYGLACLYAQKGDSNRALDCLEKALENWYPVPEPILQEPLFKKIRKTKRFKTMMQKHFPNASQ